jgi:hypothetical protein
VGSWPGNESINLALMRVPRRSESVDQATLAETFVDLGPLFPALRSTDHQILFGRRGTGKTHALLYLGEALRQAGEVAIYLDLRTIGSSGGLYADGGMELAHRGTRLLVDTLEGVHDGLLSVVLDEAMELGEAATSALLAQLDRFAEATSSVEIVGEVEEEVSGGREHESGRGVQGGVSMDGLFGPGLGIGGGSYSRDADHSQTRTRTVGVARHRVIFGPIGRALQRISATLHGRRVWLLLDEWSSVPADLQPLLADLLRRTVFPVRGVVVKIGAIERRSRFSVPAGRGGYVGIELGADATADLDLDDFMAFDSDDTRAEGFFRNLLARHVAAQLASMGVPGHGTPAAFVAKAFRHGAFIEFVRAASGVPRDAINVAALAAQRARTGKISVADIRSAAKDWYLRDKEAAIAGHRAAQALLTDIVNEVIGRRGSRTFLLERADAAGDPLILDLYDARVLHVLKRGIVPADRPGIRYDGFAIDYGCYVDLLISGDSRLEGSQRLLSTLQLAPDSFRAIASSVLELLPPEAAEPSGKRITARGGRGDAAGDAAAPPGTRRHTRPSRWGGTA